MMPKILKNLFSKKSEQKSGEQYMERRRQDIISSTKSDIELIHSARLGTYDYDFESA
jgi:hypothetical protein